MSALWNLVKTEESVKTEGPLTDRPLLDRRVRPRLLFQGYAAGGMEHACVLLQVFQ